MASLTPPLAGPPPAAAASLAVRITEVAPDDNGATLVAVLSGAAVPVTLIGTDHNAGHAIVVGGAGARAAAPPAGRGRTVLGPVG